VRKLRHNFTYKGCHDTVSSRLIFLMPARTARRLVATNGIAAGGLVSTRRAFRSARAMGELVSQIVAQGFGVVADGRLVR